MKSSYARLPNVGYIEPILSARAPTFEKLADGWACSIAFMKEKEHNLIVTIYSGEKELSKFNPIKK